MNNLKALIKKHSIQLLIWDFDGVIFDLDWNYQSTVSEFIELLYNEIHSIDDTIINDKEEFISRQFPYPEINEIGIKYGKDAQKKVKLVYKAKEDSGIINAKPNQEIITFIKNSNVNPRF